MKGQQKQKLSEKKKKNKHKAFHLTATKKLKKWYFLGKVTKNPWCKANQCFY